MRSPKFLSYSALTTFEKSPDEYVLRYLAEARPPREPQKQPAAAGSAFDAYEKSDLHALLFGVRANRESDYSFEALFESQVEPHNRDWAREAGKYLKQCYHVSGMHDTLVDLLKGADEDPRFEFSVTGEILGVPILGKPDCEFVRKGRRVVLDWKVMGFCAKKSGISPAKGYRLCRDGFESDKPSRSHEQAHPKFRPMDVDGMEVNELCLEDSKTEWADQLSIYGWALGSGDLGDETIYMIDQLVGKPMPDQFNLIRVANFRAGIRPSYQQYVADRLVTCWNAVQSGHIFQDRSREESDAEVERLCDQAKRIRANPTSVFSRFCRPTTQFRG